MPLFTPADLKALADPVTGDNQISLFMPTHRFGEGIDADKLRWKNLLSGVERVLADQLRRPEIEALLAPARALQEDETAWQHMSDGLAMFLRPDWHRTFQVPAPMPTLATVGDRLVMGPMLRLLPGDEHFLVLALSQQEIRLLEGSRNTVEQVHLNDIPTSLKEVIEPEESRSDSMARPAATAGRGGAAVFYGHGAGDQHLKNEQIVKFLRTVSTGLRDVLVGQTAPMVLIGLEQLVSAYRDVDDYAHILEQVVDHNPDRLSPDELHQKAWPLVEQRLRQQRGVVIDHFHELNGTGRVSSDLPTVSQAAAEGRVETLFVKADPWCWEGVSDDPEPVVRLGADERYAECEKLDTAAVATLSNSGQVFATSQTVAPEAEIAAIFRY